MPWLKDHLGHHPLVDQQLDDTATLFQGNLRNMQQENVRQRLEERRSQRHIQSPLLQGNDIQPLIVSSISRSTRPPIGNNMQRQAPVSLTGI
jgi:hypothetical protein